MENEENDNNAQNGSVLLDFTASFKGGDSEVNMTMKKKKKPPPPPQQQQSKKAMLMEKPWQRSKQKPKMEQENSGDKENIQDMLNADESASLDCSRERSEGEILLAMETREQANVEDIDLSNMNARLVQLGYERVDVNNMETMVGVVEELLQELQNAHNSFSAYESRAHRATADCKRLQEDRDAYKLQVQCLKQDKVALENQAVVTQTKHKKEKQRMDSWVKELQVNVAKLEGLQKAWQASLNRKEAEYDRLQKRMQILQSQRDKSIKRAIEMDRPLAANFDDGERSSTLEDLANDMDTSNQRKVATLLQENAKLRTSLSSLQNVMVTKLSTLIETSQPQVQEGGGEEPIDNVDAIRLEERCFLLPADQVAQKVQALQEKIEVLLSNETFQRGRDDDDNEETDQHDDNQSKEQLRDFLKQAKLIITEQDALLRMSLFGPANDGKDETASVEVCQQYKMEQEIEDEKQVLEVLRERLESERAMIVEEAKRLDDERAAFEKERFQLRMDSLGAAAATTAKNFDEDDDDDHSSIGLSTPTPSTTGRKKKKKRQSLLEKVSTPISVEDLPLPATPATKRLLKQIYKQ